MSSFESDDLSFHKFTKKESAISIFGNLGMI
jgi:hypothetical protein